MNKYLQLMFCSVQNSSNKEPRNYQTAFCFTLTAAARALTITSYGYLTSCWYKSIFWI